MTRVSSWVYREGIVVTYSHVTEISCLQPLLKLSSKLKVAVHLIEQSIRSFPVLLSQASVTVLSAAVTPYVGYALTYAGTSLNADIIMKNCMILTMLD